MITSSITQRREDIRLFVKPPDGFKVEMPVGTYNPDWAIVKHDDETVYLVRETKGTKDFLKLHTAEADKVRCGQRHFEAARGAICSRDKPTSSVGWFPIIGN